MVVRSYKENKPYVMLNDSEQNPQAIHKILKKASDKGYSGITMNIQHVDPDYDEGKYNTMLKIIMNTTDLALLGDGKFTQKVTYNPKEKRKEYGGYWWQMRFQFLENIVCGRVADISDKKGQGRSL